MEAYIIVTAVIRNQDKYLIAKRAATKKFAPGQWEFISGFMDTPESPEETILREIKEELSVQGIITRKSKSFQIIDDEGEWTIVPFLVELDSQNVQINYNDHSEIRWVVASDLNNYSDLKPFLDSKGIQEFLQEYK